jgi:hypothetical protein
MARWFHRETSLDVLTFFFDHHLGLASRLFMKLGLPAEIERQVVKAHEDWFDASKACAIRNLTGMTWAGYRHLASSLFSIMNSITGKYEPIQMPFGTSPIRLPRTWKLIEFEKSLLDAFGLKQSDDGLTAWADIIPLMTLRLDAISIECFPPRGVPLKVFFGADSFRMYKGNSVKAVLCVVKAMVERKDEAGNRLTGWAINSGMNCVKAAIFEGGDSYVEMCTKGSMIQRQLSKLQEEGLTIHKGRDTEEHKDIRLGIFGDMSFINAILGSGGCSTNNSCPKCDCQKHQFLWPSEEFVNRGEHQPRPMTILRRNMLAHAYGPEYGLHEPYVCEGCNKTISQHG